MELCTKDTCIMKADTVLESRYGLITLNTKVNGERTKPTDVESSGTQMVTSTRESGKMTKLMATASIST